MDGGYRHTMDTEMKKKFLTNQFGDRYLYEVNGHSFDQAGASTLFAKTYGDTFATADTFYLVAGRHLLPGCRHRLRTADETYRGTGCSGGKPLPVRRTAGDHGSPGIASRGNE